MFPLQFPGMLYENVENVKKDKNGDANMNVSADEVPGPSTGAIPKTKQSKPKKSGKRVSKFLFDFK